MKLRPYQINTRNELYDYIRSNRGKNPCIVLPTGAGKSLVIAQIARDFFNKNKGGRLIMLTHVKELIEQNYNKVCSFIGKSDVGIYSSGLGSKDLTKKITFAGIQSIHKVNTPSYKVIIIDECHLINTRDEGNYRKFINKHPDALVIGLTATPYRMNNGFIHEGNEAIFHDLISPAMTGIKDLVQDGYLSKLKSKVSDKGYDFKGVKKKNGEFNNKEVNDIVNHFDAIDPVITDIIDRTRDKKHVLVFCSGVEHSENVAKSFKEHGERSCHVHGKMTKEARKFSLDSFKAGFYKYLCNPNILTTGFDFPDIDCVVMLRPTASTGLYMQIVGRGMRLKKHTDHCLILDYVGNIERHGSVLNPNVKGKSTPKQNICPECLEVNEPDSKVCSECGHEFPDKKNRKPKEKEDKKEGNVYALYNVDIMKEDEPPLQMDVTSWEWKIYTSRKDGLRGVICRIHSADSFVNIFYPVENDSAKWPMIKNLEKMKDAGALVILVRQKDPEKFIEYANELPLPSRIIYKKDKFVNVLSYEYL